MRVLAFASDLAADSSHAAAPGATALGTALATLPTTAAGQALDAVVVVSDGVVNAGDDPVAVARGLGVPVHTVWVGRPGAPDRAVMEIEAPPQARVGEATRCVHHRTTEPQGSPFTVRLLDGGSELARATVVSPGAGADPHRGAARDAAARGLAL